MTTTLPLEQPGYGQLVRQRREERNMLTAELAAEARIRPKYLRNIELGHDGVPSRRVQIALAKALNCSALGPTDAHPTNPPKQPKKGPQGPTRRQEKEGTRRGPKRVTDQQAEAVA